MRRPLLGLVLLAIGGPALAQGPQGDVPKRGAGPPASSGAGQSKSWADEVRSSISEPPKGDGKTGGDTKPGGDAKAGGGGGQPGPKR